MNNVPRAEEMALNRLDMQGALDAGQISRRIGMLPRVLMRPPSERDRQWEHDEIVGLVTGTIDILTADIFAPSNEIADETERELAVARSLTYAVVIVASRAYAELTFRPAMPH